MNKFNLNDNFETANGFIQNARNELFRAEEDVVPQLIFNNVRAVLKLVFTSFLHQRGHSPGPIGLHDMGAYCARLDSRFGELSMELVPHEGNEQMRYINMDNLEKCIDVAEKAVGLMQHQAWPESKRVK